VSSRAAAVAAVPSRSALFGKRSIVDELKDIEENADGSNSGDGDAASSAQKAKKEKVSDVCSNLATFSHSAITSGVLNAHI
jgi:hypothetical protein